MFRPGKNPKEQPHTDDTADHTPQSTTPHGSGGGYASGSNSPGGGSQQQTATEAYQQSVHTPTTSRAVTESESLARDIKEGTLTGFVGNGTTLHGEANFKGMLRVDGTLSGRVSSQDGTLIVSTNGVVDANVEVAIAQIYGTVNGDITATKRIEMGRVAKVAGNIEAPALVIENGAIFEGSCRMVQAQADSDKRLKGEATASAGASTSASGASPSSSTSPAASGSGASTSSSSASSTSSKSSSSPYGSASSLGASGSTGTSDVKDASDVTN
jgi:cytoskeletal protein CcmA (bactofilin family)